MTDNHQDSEEMPADLAPLDPVMDTRRFDSLAKAIVTDGMAARRQAGIGSRGIGVLADVARWSIPVLAAATLVIGISLSTFAWSAQHFSLAAARQNVASDRFGLPAPVIALTRSGSNPTPADVVAAFDSRWLEVPR